mgnify:CR=1 FL=1
MTVNSNTDNIKLLMDWIKTDLKPLFKVNDKYMHLKLCLQEALTNSIIHGNLKDEKKKLTVSYVIEDKLKIKIEDEGNGVQEDNQIKSIKDIKKKDIFNESGRGIMLMKHFCDEVIFDHNKITLVIQYQ